MKDSAWDNKLWQDKMQELPLQGDVNAAWLNMQSLLDENMPAGQPAAVKIARNSWQKIIISAIIIAIITALIYFTGKVILGGHQPKTNKEIPKSAQQNTNTPASEEPGKSNLSPGESSPTGKTGVKADSMSGKGSIYSSPQGSQSVGKLVINPKGQTKDTDGLVTSNNARNPRIMPNYGGRNSNKTILHNHRGKTANNNALGPHSTGKSNLHNQAAKGGRNSVAPSTSTGVGNTQPQSSNQQNALADSAALIQSGSNTKAAGSNLKTAADSIKALLTGGTKAPASGDISPVLKPDSTSKKISKAKTDSTQKTKKPKTVKASNSKFELAIKIGANSNGSFTSKSQNSNFYGSSKPDAFAGIFAAYYVSPKISLGIGFNLLSPKIVSGSSSFSNYNYTTADDTGKKTTHLISKATVNSTRKLYSIDIPVVASYHLNKYISFNAGPVISLPVKQLVIKNTLGTLSAPVDSTGSVYLKNFVNSAEINNKLNFGLTGGLRVNAGRLFIDGAYMQNITPFTMSTSFSSSKIYYHTFQFGVGFLLFRPKTVNVK
jgi:hypothetical protein